MSTCTRCGATFSCAMVAGEDNGQPCWCTALPAIMPVPTANAASCFCPACLRQVIAQQQEQHSQQ